MRRLLALVLIAGTLGPAVSAPAAAETAGPPAPAEGTEAVQLAAQFVSSLGWVKPGDAYAFRIVVRNLSPAPAPAGAVTIDAPDGTTFTGAESAMGLVASTARRVTWSPGDVPGDGTAILVVDARAADLRQDPRIVWKDLSAAATLRRSGGETVVAETHGPKVIPPGPGYETARYGDRPFPVVPVDYADRKHRPESGGDVLSRTINDPAEPGSTVNLYREMSYGQLFPSGTVPSNGIATAGWQYAPGFDFTRNRLPPPSTCAGATLAGREGSLVLPERIRDGWYQLPGTTGYYGSDAGGSNLTGVASSIDAGCGPTGKLVYDAAAIADPELDYNDFDTDKDGLVDFFMVVFAGCGGNGASQTPAISCEGHETEVPYDNVWPHSSTLEGEYFDQETGLTGYVSDDRLTDLAGRPMFYTDATRLETTVEDTGLPAFVRVGPYNVNPETAIAHASVISHEYGHSLGLPDYYSLAGPDFYGRWNLMATDYSQHMDVVARRELGWIVPAVLPPGETAVKGMVDSKVNTHRIEWATPDGDPYTLEDDRVDNGQAYALALPAREIISAEALEQGASPPHVWWSGSGDNFGCTPSGGRNLDIALPQLAAVPAGTPVTLEYASSWDIEWDFDYGFTMITTDGGGTYTSLPSLEGFTTPGAENPNSNACQERYGNGLTGSSGSYAAGTEAVDRTLGTQVPGGGFLRDSYDLSAYAGQRAVVLRFSYATDVGTARPGWFIDDLKVKAGDRVLYETDFEQARDPLLFNGGCREDLRTARICTPGWQYVTAGQGDPADHLYLIELRDRSGFDVDGHGESDRGEITWEPGLTIGYTDEHEAIGNTTQADRPAQHLLDSTPTPGASVESGLPTEPTLNLDDLAFTAAVGRNRFTDAGTGHVDNYTDAEQPDGRWRLAFDCLELEVLRMTGADVAPVSNLVADVRFVVGPGCAPFTYGATPGET